MATALTHVPSLAAGGEGHPRRSLVLAGGGLHVAYQAGALAALEEAGLRFAHADATSGGTLNLAMVLSGLTPADVCRRWRALDVRRFAARRPTRRFQRGPPATALGVDLGRVRAAAGIEGTFTLDDTETQQYVAVPHTQMDADLLAAGIARGVALAPVEEAGLAEAFRHDVDEVWVVATDGLPRDPGAEHEPPVRLHVIRPRAPLPLDADLFLGRIDTEMLIAMGYRDAARHLDASASAVADPAPGVAFREELRGEVGGARMSLRLGWEIDDLEAFLADPHHRGSLVGDVTHPAIGTRRLARDGAVEVDDGWVRAELRFAGQRLELRRRIRGWRDAEARIVGASGADMGRGRLERTGPAPWWTLHARGVSSVGEGARTTARFWRWVATARR